MRNYFYSAKNNAFVARESELLLSAEFDDSIAVDDDVFVEFFSIEKDGKRRVPNKDGLPSWEVIPPPTQEEIREFDIKEAENKKAQLMAEAEYVTRNWQTDLLLGIISDADKQKLIVWREYMIKLSEVDTSTAPKITWPVKP